MLALPCVPTNTCKVSRKGESTGVGWLLLRAVDTLQRLGGMRGRPRGTRVDRRDLGAATDSHQHAEPIIIWTIDLWSTQHPGVRNGGDGARVTQRVPGSEFGVPSGHATCSMGSRAGRELQQRG